MRSAAAILIACIYGQFSFGQNHGNEWIDYSSKYLKIEIASDGIYSIDQSVLSSAVLATGDNLSGIDPRNIHLFFRGEEQKIYIEGESDGVFDAGDRLLFYGQKNDGWLDSALYPQGGNPNAYYSLFNDTSAYFLTWNTTAGERLSLVQNKPSGGRTALNHVWMQRVDDYHSSYQIGERNTYDSSDPEYGIGEGYLDGNASGSFGYLGSRTKFIATEDVYTGNPSLQAEVHTGVVGLTASQHHIEIQYGSSFTPINDRLYWDFQFEQFQFNIPLSSLGTSTTAIKYVSLALAQPPTNNNERTSIAYLQIKYPRLPDLNGASFLEFLIPSNSDSSYLVLNGATTNYSYTFDMSRGLVYELSQTGSQAEVLIEDGPERGLKVVSDNGINAVTTLSPVGTTGQFHDVPSMIFDSAFVIVSHPRFDNAVSQYVTYRLIQNQAAFSVNITDLYDQFAYGIKKHPLSIRNFCRYLIDNGQNPQYLFLVGKGISARLSRTNQNNYSNNLVPTMGFPASDNLFTVGLDSTVYEPRIPTGRLVARTDQDVLDYLNKVAEHESTIKNPTDLIDERLWMKNILHFAGGGNESEQNVFSNYLDNYKLIAEDSAMGGSVTTFYKTSSSAVQTQISDSVKILIDAGVSLMQFFGHGAGGQLGFSIGNPNLYENGGRYPLIIANSCNVGDVHNEDVGSRTLNEKFVLAAEKGAIGFLASVENGYPSYLNDYTYSFYNHFAKDSYGQSIGKIMQNTVREIQRPNQLVKWTCLEMSLHGDPSIVLNAHEKPDLAIDAESIFTEPSNVSVDLDSFELKIVLHNLGKGTNEPFEVTATQRLVEGTEIVHRATIQGLQYRDTVGLNIPIDKEAGLGENKFTVEVDLPSDNVSEIFDFSNNTVSQTVFITSDELIPISPWDLAVVPTKDIKLMCSTADLNAEARQYIFELDTSISFDSPLLIKTLKSAPGGVIEFSPNLSFMTDSMVVFWRVSPNNFYAKDMKWRYRSFQYIPDRTGTGQDHFDQFESDDLLFIKKDEDRRRFEFTPVKRTIAAQNRGNPSFGANFQELYDINFRLDGQAMAQGVCNARRSMHVAFFHPIDLEPIPYDSFNLGHWNLTVPCVLKNHYMFDVEDPNEMDSLARLVRDIIPNGTYVLVYSGMKAHFQNPAYWEEDHYLAFESLGCDSIRYVGDDHPYLFFIKKGDPTTKQEILGKHPKDVISLYAEMEGNSPYGRMTAPPIGPANAYSEFHWYVNEVESGDSIALKMSWDKDTIVGSAQYDPSILSDLNLGAAIPDGAAVNMNTDYFDNSLRTLAQKDRWHILHDYIGEVAIDPSIELSLSDTIVQQGQELFLRIAYHNVSTQDFDTLTTLYSLRDAFNQLTPLSENRDRPLEGKEVWIDTLMIETRSLEGDYQVLAEINPLGEHWQIEHFSFNNKAALKFEVVKDQSNPLLDVTFDGIHIMDKDIVSAQPNILIRLKDENLFVALEDTTSMDVYLTGPNGDQERIPFVDARGVEILHFESNFTSKKNEATIEYNPSFNLDGIYELQVVGKDATGNSSGNRRYGIRFEVVRASTITNLINYPNPFSTSTRFVFVLTGSTLPEELNIQIMTVSGQVVREIGIEELGPINIGRNVSEFRWDGTDSFGDRLANGVYLYRMKAVLNGQEMELRNSSVDQYFHEGYGKMFLIR